MPAYFCMSFLFAELPSYTLCSFTIQIIIELVLLLLINETALKDSPQMLRLPQHIQRACMLTA